MNKITKRLISAGLVVALVITMIQVIPRQNTMDVTYAAGLKEAVAGDVIRDVVDSITDLPQYGVENFYNIEYGTPERPFLVLEIVPYEEFAEFGYLIGGCEPIAIEKLDPVTMENVYATITTMSTCDLLTFTANTVIYFSDEPEFEEYLAKDGAVIDNYQTGNGLYGYYELVPMGKGTFLYTPATVSGGDAGSVSGNDISIDPTIQIAEDGNGNLIWHTINEFNYKDNDQRTLAEYLGLYPDIVFKDSQEAISESDLRNVGDRIYTKRSASDYQVPKNKEPAFDCVVLWNQKYTEYFNKELFLRNSVLPGADDEKIANFSVLVKTITPADLNKRPDWIDYADLISISPKMHAGDNNYVELWKQYNRLGKDSDLPHYNNLTKNFEGDRDLSWECALKIYNKVTADDNFAALVLDDTGYNTVPGPTKNITIDVYNWNLEKNQKYPTYNHSGSSNNYYKLCSMLFCMDSHFFKEIYLNKDNPLIYEENGVGKVRLQTGDAAEYWCMETFLLAPDAVETHLYDYWTGAKWQMWEKYAYATCDIATTRKGWCYGHVYAYDGSNSLAQGFVKMDILTNVDKFPDFRDSLEKDEQPHTAEAIQYILGKRSNKNPDNPVYGQGQTLKVLDLEPSVDLDENENPKYYLKPSYFTMLLPHFRGNLQVTHQTTSEFIGKIEDLNSIYDMIYIGLDISGYNTRTNGDGATITDWNDDSLDGKIYMRTGDLAIGDYKPGSDSWGSLTVNWLLDKATLTQKNSNYVRFAGNDISVLKKNDLVDYLNAGYPIVLEQQLYNCVVEHKAERADCIIEKNTRLYDLIDQNKNRDNIIGTANTDSLEKAVEKALGDDIIFQDIPVLYDGTTNGVASATFVNTNCYLPRSTARETLGQPYLSFGITAAKPGYKYDIYVDLNRDSKFTKEEIQSSGSLNEGYNPSDRIRVYLPEDWVGLLQWKIRVYLENTGETVRYELTGCSAVDLNTSSAKQKEVSVLQIMPDDINFQGALNLEESELFRKYYENLKDYHLTIKSITYSEYKSYFVDKEFKYDFTKELSDSNPVNVDNLDGGLMDYNMLIVGFGDCYAKTSITNEYGQLDFLRFFTDQGKSILYTHDLTTFYNEVKTDISFYPTTRLRDVMGMNRYGSINYYYYTANDINDETREYLLDNSNSGIYDTNNTDLTHGYTYFAIKRIGNNNSTAEGLRMPYRYISGNYLKEHLEHLPNGTNSTNDFNFMNEITTQATKVNEGQITVYPYAIDEELLIAFTHGQYYQLNPEDENLTVWYCLAGDDHSRHGSGDGTSLSYAVSPNDTMNNYYIYSKGNIFYSGVGHETVTSDMEAKLFVNTMIAAYTAGSEPPKVRVTNSEAVMRSSLQYDIELMQNYDFDQYGEIKESVTGDYYVENEAGEKVYYVTFTPVDYNLTNDAELKLECRIQWENGAPVTKVEKLNADGEVERTLYADSNNEFRDDNALEKDNIYRLEYPMKYFNDYEWELEDEETGETKSGKNIRIVYFNINNNRVKASNTTVLNIDMLPLFPLD